MANHRSLQGELLALVSESVLSPSTIPDAVRSRQVRSGYKSIEQIVAELRERFPQPEENGLLAVDIIRADRDAR